MRIRKPLLAALIAASLGGISIPMHASAAVEIFFNAPPPQLRHEVVPAPRRGHLWVPGHWDARGNKHAWRAGRWERERAGYRYVEPRWVARNDGWALERGRWNRGDRDGDGVPNRIDRSPDNPNRR